MSCAELASDLKASMIRCESDMGLSRLCFVSWLDSIDRVVVLKGRVFITCTGIHMQCLQPAHNVLSSISCLH